jgi:sugar phosphate isomerase/epimerase
VCLILDVKSMCAKGRPLPEIIARGVPYASHVDANDANRGAPGSGEVDFQPILASLTAAGYTGWVSVEVFDFSAGAEVIARDSLAYLRACAS